MLNIVGGQTGEHSENAHICLTPACVHASSEILYNLSPDYKNIDPCTDFEELVCGGWRDRHDLRPDQGDAFTGTMMFESSQTLLRHILESTYPGSSAHSFFSPALLRSSESSADEDNFNKLQAAYDACLDEKTIKQVGATPLVDILRDVSKTFMAAESGSALSETILYLHQIGIAALVSPFTGADDKDPDTVVVSVSAPYRIGLPAKELYKDTVILSKYETVLADVVSNLYTGQPLENATFHGVVEFEKKLADALPDAQDRNDVTVCWPSFF
jgi:endothelin-converting enzyme